jgi:arylsulfatase A-like enzyme
MFSTDTQHMIGGINRRDFLRLAGLLPLSAVAPRWTQSLSAPGPQKNVIVVVFDAFSAYNISLYGYQRETTPNLARLAKRAIRYRNHYAGSNFTTSGTASLLTGTLPWTHRALQPNGKVADAVVSHNIFSVFDDYYRAAYTQNGWAFTLLRQFQPAIDQLVPIEKFFLGSYDYLIETLFRNDDDIAFVSWARNIKLQGGYSYSLFLSQLYAAIQNRKTAGLQPLFPRGLPDFLLDQAIDWTGNLALTIPQPFFGYFHFLPPHDPYDTSLQFYNWFENDDYEALKKPVDVFATDPSSNEHLKRLRRDYDEYVRYVDEEFGRLYQALEKSGLLENSWLILTSDHGEMFERGMWGHGSDALYQPLVRVPLLIFEPGREAGMDVRQPTSAVDLLPTLAHLTAHTIPDWTEGMILPPYAVNQPGHSRGVYAVKATANDPHAPLTHASTMLVRGRYKLLYYFGYSERGVSELIKLFDVQADPEELVDLSSSNKVVAAKMLSELKSRISEIDAPYR